MIAHSPESIKAMVQRMGEACLQGEQHALDWPSLKEPKITHNMYRTKEEYDAYLIGMRRQQEIMRGDV